MKVNLLTGTQNPIDTMYFAARTCYCELGYQSLFDEVQNKTKDQKFKLLDKILYSGHLSIAEHVSLTFHIEGISRACSHQLVRHRLCTFSQQSQRYVKITENVEELRELIDYKIKSITNFSQNIEKEEKYNNIISKYFCNGKEDKILLGKILVEYLEMIQRGIKPEDARVILPNCTKTNIVMTTNFRNLIHMCELRLCTRAQSEIRTLFKMIVEEVSQNYSSRLSDYLICQCDRLRYCPEEKGCGRYLGKYEMLREREEDF